MSCHYVAADIIEMLKLGESGDLVDSNETYKETAKNYLKAMVSHAIETLQNCEAKMLLQQKLIA